MSRKRLASMWLALLTLLGSSHAQPLAAHATATVNEVRLLLESANLNPNLQAARSLASSARLNAAAVQAPLDFNVQVSSRNVALEIPPIPPSTDITTGEQTTRELSARLVLRPFLYGDLADLYDQRIIEAERAHLQEREAQASLEVQALNAAMGVWLSGLARDLALEALTLAEAAEAATLRRAQVGGANVLEVARAELASKQAHANLRDAERQHLLARARLDLLAPGASLTGPPAFTPVFGPTPEQLRSALDQQLVQLAKRNANRATQPTLQAAYTWIGDDGNVTVGIESRTLQPSISVALSEVEPRAPAPTIPTPKATGSLTLGLSWTISLQARGEANAAQQQATAADHNAEAANARAALTEQTLLLQIIGAQEAITLTKEELEISTLERDIAERRFEAGSIGELERLQAHLAYQQAQLNFARARLNEAASILETYSAYAIAPSQVLP